MNLQIFKRDNLQDLGMIKGSGFLVKTRPDSYAASTVANRDGLRSVKIKFFAGLDRVRNSCYHDFRRLTK